MKDLSKEEKLEQRISELEYLIAKKDYDFDKEQGKRIRTTFFVLSGAIYLIAFMWDGMNNIKDYLFWLLGAPLIAGFAIFISFMILLHIMNGATNRTETIAKLKGELEAIKFIKYE